MQSEHRQIMAVGCGAITLVVSLANLHAVEVDLVVFTLKVPLALLILFAACGGALAALRARVMLIRLQRQHQDPRTLLNRVASDVPHRTPSATLTAWRRRGESEQDFWTKVRHDGR